MMIPARSNAARYAAWEPASDPVCDIAAFAPLSIKSGGDFTDILAQESPDLWTSNRAARGGSARMLKVVEKAVAIAEENKARGTGDNHEGAPASAYIDSAAHSMGMGGDTVQDVEIKLGGADASTPLSTGVVMNIIFGMADS